MKTIKVSKWILSKIKTINVAIDQAEDGDTIKVAPGIYRETIRVNKNIKIIGKGSKDNIILDNIIVEGDVSATIIGLSVQSEDYESVLIKAHSSLSIDNCTLTNVHEMGKGISIDKMAKLNISNSVIKNSHYGIEINTSGDCRINNCSFYGNKNSIYGYKESNIAVNNSIIQENKEGISVLGRLQINNCLIQNNMEEGISVHRGIAEIKNSKFQGGGSSAISNISGKVFIDNTIVNQQEMDQIYCYKNAEIKARNTKLTNGCSFAITISQSSKGIFENCEVLNNAEYFRCSNSISGQSEASFMNCCIKASKSAGIDYGFAVENFSKITIQNSEVLGYKYNEFYIDEDSTFINNGISIQV